MRELLNILDIQLNESTGLAGRKPGDAFKNPAGEIITFADLMFFPDGGGKFTSEELDQALEQVDQDIGSVINWQNNRSTRSGGFAIATFDSEQGPIYFGRFVESIKPNLRDNNIPNSVGEYKFAGKAAEKTQSGLTPQDLLTNKTNLTIKDIMLQLAQSLGVESPLYTIAYQIAMGTPLPAEIDAPEGLSFTAFRDYFCEILQPMALQNGLFSGDGVKAAEQFFGTNTFAGTTISFDDSKNAGLSDSVLESADGRIVKISSKGAKGAPASSKNLLDSLEAAGNSPEGQALAKKHKDVIDIIKLIRDSGQAQAPLVLGVKFGVITQDDAVAVNELKNMSPINLSTVKNMNNLSSNLKSLAMGRNTKDPVNTNLYYHILAAIAQKAADQVNERTNFSQAASQILNNGALVQVYTIAKQTKGKWILEDFKSQFPSEAVTGVVLWASKSYYSTNIKQNYTFKILRNGAVAEPDQAELAAKEPDEDLSVAATAIINPKVKKSPKNTDFDVGRKKR